METGLEELVHEEAQLLTFRLDDQEYALDISNVVQVVRMVAITPVPKAPDVVEGVINLRGKVVPVINLRKRCGLANRPYGLNDHLLIAKMDGRVMGLIVDVVSEMLTVPMSDLDFSSEIGSQMEYLSAVGRLGDRLLLVLDPGTILTFEDKKCLEVALARTPSL
jgi:purine-binding chemotaxis protein CheW